MPFVGHRILLVFLMGAVFAACKSPFATEAPVELTRRSVNVNASVSDILPAEFETYDGVLLAYRAIGIDSVSRQVHAEATFFNYLGNGYRPRQPFHALFDGQQLLDTVNIPGEFTALVAPPARSEWVWNIQGGRDAPTFTDSIEAPDEVTIEYPDTTHRLPVPREQFAVRFTAPGSDSVFVQVLIIDPTIGILYFHIPNTGVFEFTPDLLSRIPPEATLAITISSVRTKVSIHDGKTILLRAVYPTWRTFTFSD